MTDTAPTTEVPDTAQPIGTLEHLDPVMLEIGENVRHDAALTRAFIASIAENGVLVPITGVRSEDNPGVVRVRNGQRRIFPGKSPCCLGRCWPRAEVGAVTTSPGLGQSWRHTIVAQMLRVRCRGHGSNRRKQP